MFANQGWSTWLCVCIALQYRPPYGTRVPDRLVESSYVALYTARFVQALWFKRFLGRCSRSGLNGLMLFAGFC